VPDATASRPKRGWRGACRMSSRSAASSTRGEAEDAHKRIGHAKLDALVGLCEAASCRRVALLGYFGEASQPCGNCDVCLNPPTLWDGTEAAQKMLSTVYRTGQRFGAGHVLDVLLGKTTEKIDRFGHHQLSVFGIGASQADRVWRAVLRQLVMRGLLEVDHTAYGALKLTAAARPVLKGEETVMLRAIEARPARSRKPRFAPSSGEGVHNDEDPLFLSLRAWRRETANEKACPPTSSCTTPPCAKSLRAVPPPSRNWAKYQGWERRSWRPMAKPCWRWWKGADQPSRSIRRPA
jgi:superfamily II DNA helicase RecQ